MDDAHATAALNRLCSFLSVYYGKKVIILLDEYDTPMQEACVDGYWTRITSFIHSMFNSTFKTNPYLERAIMTGITRVSRESRQYEASLIAKGIPAEKIRKYGFAFCGKRVLIG